MKTKKAVMPPIPRRFKSKRFKAEEAAREAEERRRAEQERLASMPSQEQIDEKKRRQTEQGLELARNIQDVFSTPENQRDEEAEYVFIYYETYEQTKLRFLPAFNCLMQGSEFLNEELVLTANQIHNEFIRIVEDTGIPSGVVETSDFLNGIPENKFKILETLLRLKIKVELESLNKPWITSVVKRDFKTELGFIATKNDHWVCVRKVHNYWFYFDALNQFRIPEIIDNDFLNEFILLMIKLGYFTYAVKSNQNLPEPPKQQIKELVSPFKMYRGIKETIKKHLQGIHFLPRRIELPTPEHRATLDFQANHELDKQTLLDQLHTNPSNFTYKFLERDINKYVEQMKSKVNLKLISSDYKDVEPIHEHPDEGADDVIPEEETKQADDEEAEGEGDEVDEQAELERAMAESMKTQSVQSSD